MKIYVNSKNEIKDVETTTDETLTVVEINDADNPFAGWSVAKICCYKVEVKDGQVTMFAPYVDTKIIEHIDKLGKKNAELEAQDAMLTATVDSILTDVIPSLFG